MIEALQPYCLKLSKRIEALQPYLNRNPIKDLPDLSNLPINSLDIGFDITNDNLEHLQSLTKLRDLVLETEMTVVPNTLLKLTELERLIINVKIENIPLFIFDLPKIRVLSLYKEREMLLFHFQGSDIDHITYIKSYLVKKYSLKQRMPDIEEFERSPFS